MSYPMCQASTNSSSSWSCRALVLLGIASMLLVINGCGGTEVAATSLADAQAAFDRGMAAVAKGDYSSARGDFDVAVKSGGLTVDNYVEALLNRSMCLSVAGEYEAAEADIAAAEQGATELEQVHVARGFMLAKKGDSAGAQAAFAEAKKINPKVVLPTL